MFDIPDPLLRHIISLSKKLCEKYEQTLEMQGVSIDVLNYKDKTSKYRHFHLHVIPRYDKNNARDPANVKPSQAFPRESDANLGATLSKVINRG